MSKKEPDEPLTSAKNSSFHDLASDHDIADYVPIDALYNNATR
jgi:hypothetical protein